MQKTAKAYINTRKFFDENFTHEFRQKDGNKQTIFFCKIALENFPNWLIQDLKKGLSVADVGCAMGECVDLLQKRFKKSKVVGIDFSSVAIKEARINFPKNIFFCKSLINLGNKYDLVFSSNTLEHFRNPLIKLERLMHFVNKYVVLLIPFQEYELTSSHFYTFDYDNIPLALEDFSLAYAKVITTWNIPNNHWPGTPKWPGKQILVIYAKNQYIKSKKISLQSISLDNNSNIYKQHNSELLQLNQQMEENLKKIYNSTFWKIVRVYYKIRDLIISPLLK